MERVIAKNRALEHWSAIFLFPAARIASARQALLDAGATLVSRRGSALYVEFNAGHTIRVVAAAMERGGLLRTEGFVARVFATVKRAAAKGLRAS